MALSKLKDPTLNELLLEKMRDPAVGPARLRRLAERLQDIDNKVAEFDELMRTPPAQNTTPPPPAKVNGGKR